MTNLINKAGLAIPQQSMTRGRSEEVTGAHPVTGVEVRIFPGGDGPAREELTSRDKAPQDLAEKLQHQLEPPIGARKVEVCNSIALPPDSDSPPSPSPSPSASPLVASGAIRSLAEAGLSRFGDVTFEDWRSAKNAFRSLVTQFAVKGDKSSYQEALQRCRTRLPQLNTDDLTFRPERKIVNVAEPRLRAEFDSRDGAGLSGVLIVQLADAAIRKASVDYAEMIDAATTAVCSEGGVQDEEKPEVLRYLIHLACDQSNEHRASPDFFRNHLASLCKMDSDKRQSEIGAVLKKELPIESLPSRLIDSLENIPFKKSSQKILQLQRRPLVAVKFGTIRIPFYRSSGQFVKPGVVSGCWYPIFGIGPKSGWMNKTPDMSDYYGSAKLEKISKLLDSDFGDLPDVGPDLIPSTKELPEATLAFLNRDVAAVEIEGAVVQDGQEKAAPDNPVYLAWKIETMVDLLEADEKDRGKVASFLAEGDLDAMGVLQGSPGYDDLLIEKYDRYLGAQEPMAISSRQSTDFREGKV
jgi:hypothetical protein